jgi:hypothetical protein
MVSRRVLRAGVTADDANGDVGFRWNTEHDLFVWA